MLFQRLELPFWLKNGIQPLKKHQTKKYEIYGGDSETNRGEPISFQFWNPNDQRIIFTNKKSAVDDFFDFLDSLPTNDTTYVIYCLNLEFDIISFFYSQLEILRTEEIEGAMGDYKIRGFFGNTVYMIFNHVNSHKTIFLIALDSFFKGSLVRLTEVFKIPVKKLKHPVGLGYRNFTIKDTEFCEYAMRDSEICYWIGLIWSNFQNKYGISQCVSLPQAAAKIYKLHYVKQLIPNPGKQIYYSALRSYHGGKNNLAVNPQYFKNCFGLDIRSAYTEAMANMPSFYEKSLYNRVVNPKTINSYGIYRIRGEIIDCKWPILFDHGFKKITGNIDRNWVTGFELNESIKMGEFKPKHIEGIEYQHKLDKNESPLKKYAEEMFELKNTADNEIEQYLYKLLSNALYGKFIQSKKETNDGKKQYFDMINKQLNFNLTIKGGGLFQPFIASLITGFVRGKIHKLEHKYKALHTSTDGIITELKPIEADLINKLGGLKIEFQGDVLILRNKLYIAYSNKEPEQNPIKSLLYPNKYVVKYALHGYHGSLRQLEKMILKRRWHYKHTHVNKLKESFNRDLIPNKFERVRTELKLKGFQNA